MANISLQKKYSYFLHFLHSSVFYYCFIATFLKVRVCVYVCVTYGRAVPFAVFIVCSIMIITLNSVSLISV